MLCNQKVCLSWYYYVTIHKTSSPTLPPTIPEQISGKVMYQLPHIKAYLPPVTILPSWSPSSNMCTTCNIKGHIRNQQSSCQNNHTSIIEHNRKVNRVRKTCLAEIVFNIKFGFRNSPSPALPRRFILEFRRNNSPTEKRGGRIENSPNSPKLLGFLVLGLRREERRKNRELRVWEEARF